MFFYVWILVIPTVLAGLADINSDNFGPFYVNIEQIEPCGNIRKAVGNTEIRIVTDEAGNKAVFGNFTLFKDMKQPSYKVKMQILTKKGYETLLNYKVDNICDCRPCVSKLFAIAANFRTIDTDCLVDKGSKNFTIDPNTYVHQWIGEKYFYGRFRLTSSYFVKRSTAFCFIAYISIEKPKKN